MEGKSNILEKINASVNALTHPMHQFELVILLANFKKSYEGKNVTSHRGGGEGVREMSPNVTRGEGGSKKCEKSVTYYLNGP